jgi:hypothetical protein
MMMSLSPTPTRRDDEPYLSAVVGRSRDRSRVILNDPLPFLPCDHSNDNEN